MLDYRNYIESKHTIMLGKPVIKGTRISVEIILKKISEGCPITEILEIYPNLKSEQILACMEYAAEVVSNEVVLELAL